MGTLDDLTALANAAMGDLWAQLQQALGGALGPHTQHTRLLRLHTPLGPDVLLAERALIDEHIGPVASPFVSPFASPFASPFSGLWRDAVGPAGAAPAVPAGCRVQVQALSAQPDLDLASLIGQPVLLELLTQLSVQERRPFHGHVLRASRLGSDGGLTRWALDVQPWLAFLGHGRDSWVFQEQTVMDIVDEVFGGYDGQGCLQPAWRWDLADPGVYARRSLCVQYQESDLAFVQRLMLEEGLFGWWEHEGDPASASLGRHVFVIADHNGALKPNAQPRVRYTQSHLGTAEDSLVRWQRRAAVHTAQVALASRDYRSVALRPVQAVGRQPAVPELLLSDVPGVYAYEDNAQGQRLADMQAQALDALRTRCVGRGSWRTAAPGTWFTLIDHPVHNGSDPSRDVHTILGVRHEARNNLAADIRAQVDSLLGSIGFDNADALHLPRRQQLGNERDDLPIYQCQLLAQPLQVPVRMAALDAQGLPDPRVAARPTVTGVQTALVVGLSEPVHGDRDHRVKLQFHWQRGDRASHRLAHALGQNAPATTASGTWVRVAASVAGANWGVHLLPRVGQEVLVAFIGGDIDRPVVIGSLYNGQGQPDAQGNQVAAGAANAVGQAPAWFPGSQPDGDLQSHQHPAVLTGIKSQELPTSASGMGGYNQLVLDDTPAQGRIELFSSSAQTRLQLGHLLHQIDNRRLQHRGHGVDLATQAWGAVRAGSGLLLSAHARNASTANAAHVDAAEALQQLTQARERLHALAQAAQQHGAQAADEVDIIGAQRADTARQLPAEQGLVAVEDSLAQTVTTSDNTAGQTANNTTIGGGHGTASAWLRPDLVGAAPQGVLLTTPASTVAAAGATLVASAGHDLNTVAEQGLSLQGRQSVSLYTHGQAGNSAKPNQEVGIKLHARQGRLSAQSQNGQTRVAAQRRVDLFAIDGVLTIAGAQGVLLAAAGAGIDLKNGAIDLKGPGSVLFKASQKIYDPGGGAGHAFASLPHVGPMPPTMLEFRRTYADGTPIPGIPCTVTLADGSVRKLKTDAQGLVRIADVPAGVAKVVYGLDPNPPQAETTLDVDDDFQALMRAAGDGAASP